jgi:hypothetical protein
VTDPIPPHTARADDLLEPMLELALTRWRGLPPITITMLEATVGPPESSEDAQLGWYPARLTTHPSRRPSGGLRCYSREGEVVLIETLLEPDASVLSELGPPSGAKAHEILVDDAYVHEWVYADRGLVLSVAEPFTAPTDRRVVRCRGVRPLATADDYGPEFHMAFEDRTSF